MIDEQADKIILQRYNAPEDTLPLWRETTEYACIVLGLRVGEFIVVAKKGLPNFIFFCSFVIILFLQSFLWYRIISIATKKPEVLITPIVPTSTPIVTPTPNYHVQIGLASYYSRAGCIGCSADRIMRNGEPLDDTRLTVAYNDAPINSFVKVTNLKTGASVRAKVTDTGGFKRHNKIIDLTPATRDAIGCGSECEVEVVL